jgi:selenide,water dikinase
VDAWTQTARDRVRSGGERAVAPAPQAGDAAVHVLADDVALIMALDVLGSVVDDPYEFGRIAAASAFARVYARGGCPLAAMNLVTAALERRGSTVLGALLRGGAHVAAQAGIAIVGGHTIGDPQPKYGLSVSGVARPEEVISLSGARPGDALVLTKPLGAGAITTARRRGRHHAERWARAVMTMTRLDDAASAAARAAGVRAMTAVSRDGLLGHLHGLARASGVSAELELAAVPVIAGALDLLVDEEAVSAASRRNRILARTFATFGSGVGEPHARLVCDATIAGGLLAAVDPQRAAALPGRVVGRVLAGQPGAVVVR